METSLATDETEKYTDVRVILAQLSGGTAAGTENRRDKVHTLQLKGYRKFDFILLHAHAASRSCCFVWRMQLLCRRDMVLSYANHVRFHTVF